MNVYIEVAKKSFKKNLMYKFNYIVGLLDTILQIFVYVSIWKSLYNGRDSVNGVSFIAVVTSFILSLAISNAFSINDLAVQNKINDGSIVSDLIRPINFKLYMLFDNVGDILFKLIMNFIPAVIFCAFTIGISTASSIVNFILSILSILLGFFILYNISWLVSLTSFWIINVWSLSTIKNVFVNVLSGIMIPIWFMPSWIKEIIKYTPFDSIYYKPINIYLGKIGIEDIGSAFLSQLFWIIILVIIGEIIWRQAIKKIIVQGG